MGSGATMDLADSGLVLATGTTAGAGEAVAAAVVPAAGLVTAGGFVVGEVTAAVFCELPLVLQAVTAAIKSSGRRNWRLAMVGMVMSPKICDLAGLVSRVDRIRRSLGTTEELGHQISQRSVRLDLETQTIQ
ncbi:hypothetical protein GCM10025770_14680 [Viridibacterium curvum]|uniref:Uncharacterized protein n=1 Tax=Viridibacterium curvum TaxID=1101404 RepID=A0ABP9QJN9_9RHOO